MLNHLLSLSVWIPILTGVLVLICSRLDNPTVSRWLALLGALMGFAVTIPLYTGFQDLHSGLQFVEQYQWITRYNIQYALGIDGISLFFVILNSFTTVLVVLAGWNVIQKRVASYFAAFLIMSGLINGSFAAMDAMLFYVFFEAMLIPMYLIIGVWGGPRRVYASVKFFLYTLLGSLLLLIAFLYLHTASGGSFSITEFQALTISPKIQTLLFFAFFASFAVKVPMWPVHTWLPDAHVEAPTGGSMVLAAITLKIGAYGFIRFCLPIAPVASHEYGWLMVVLGLVAVVYVGLVALAQSDMKKLIAYSSISHMGFVTLGLFMFTGNELNVYALEGALLQMISHGFVSAAMFMCVGVLYDRMHTRDIAAYGGVINRMPIFAAFFMLFAMANAGLPATSGFVGEFWVIMGAVQVNFWVGLLAASTLIFGAAYTLWMYKRVIFGKIANDHVAELTDVNAREILILGVLALTVLGMGLYPELFASKIHASVTSLITQVSEKLLEAQTITPAL